MPHFYATRSGDQVSIEGADARHLARSLRARPGQRISVIEPEGRLLGVRLIAVGSDQVRGVVESEAEHRPEPATRITMALAMLPASALEEALARCTELGAERFVLVQARRSVARGARPARWAAVCREAAMLAGRLRVPEVTGPVPAATLGQALVLDRSGPRRLADADLGSEPTLMVGPEGGWTDAELAGRAAFSLGPRNLRAENAAAASLAVALAVRGE